MKPIAKFQLVFERRAGFEPASHELPVHLHSYKPHLPDGTLASSVIYALIYKST